MTSHFYAACDLGQDWGRVVLGTLQNGELALNEVRRFQNIPVKDKDCLGWDIPRLYQEMLDGLRSLGGYDEPVDSISCHSWAADYMLFEADGSLITPTFHQLDPRGQDAMNRLLRSLTAEALYEETGSLPKPENTIFQLGAESSKRLRRANQLLPVGDGFNFLLTGTPRVEMSLASTTQLYNPVSRGWSNRILDSLRLTPSLLPPLVKAGTPLGALLPELVKYTGLQDARVVTTCSHEVAAALAGLPLEPGETWAFVKPGATAMMGAQVSQPVINPNSRELGFGNGTGYGGQPFIYKHEPCFWILEECQRYWQQTDRGMDVQLLTHLAGSAPAFESLINPADPRFATAGDMPLKIQAYCRETNQPVPRKPGPIFRCILESLALLYRKTLQEMEYLSGTPVQKVYIFGGSANTLLNYFVANALEVPVVVAPPETATIGNILVQAQALGHIKSLEVGHEIARSSFKYATITPHATAWSEAYDRLVNLLTT